MGWNLVSSARAQLRIEVVSAYNLVVDSNVESPSTYAPRAAYLGATFHNDGSTALTNVWAYIGDYTNGTPGTYPSRAQAPYDGPLPGDAFALTHEGGALGAADATRYLGTIQPGESETVYWLISYPNVDEAGDSVTGGIKPDDDLWLQYSIWGTALDAGTPLEVSETRTVTMRNEISAMANKIFPNGANKVPQEYQDLLALYEPSWTNRADDGSPGTVIATEGVWYDLGNVGAGFDNDGDLVPDRNAWLQPVGDADIFDSSCFRLVHTYALVIVKLNDGTETIYNVEDQLYFENIPENNRGAVGYVRYEFMAMHGGCSGTLTPYQEVASGFDNEKFNGDYGATLGQSLTSLEAHMEVAKSVDHPTIAPGETLSYTIAFTNPGPVAVGDPDAGAALVMREHIPHGTLYVGLSSTASNTLPDGVGAYTMLYSTNNGATWQGTEPADPATVTDVQWWLSDPLGTNVAGAVKLQVTVQNPYVDSPFILNEGCATIAGAGELACSATTTYVSGTNRLGDLVWADNGEGGGLLGNQVQDGGEAGLSNVTVWLYYDENADGLYDAGDRYYGSNVTSASGAYLFTNLPDGHFVAVVDAQDPDLPRGFTPTTPAFFGADLDSGHATTNVAEYLAADFGFAPALTLEKSLVSTNAFREGQYATYNLTVSNNLPGDGSGTGTLATYTAWATNGGAGATEWLNYPAAYIPPGPDGIYASNQFAAASKPFGLTNFPLGVQNGGVSNVSLLIPIAITPGFDADDTLEIQVDRIAPAQRIYTQTYLATSLVAGTWTIPMTGAFAWAWTDFATNYSVNLIAAKNAGGAGTGWVQVDAVGFRIQSDQTTGVADALNTLQPVPLTDQYDADLMEFVSAVPPPSSAATNGDWPDTTGTLTWSDVGPIYPGGTSTVAVTFKLREPHFSTETEAINAAWVTNALILSGLPANAATSTVSEILAPAATLGDYVWRDLNGDGIQNETNMGIAGVAVSLTPPAGIDLGNGPGAAITNVTDAAGYYLFESIPATGVYTVRVATATLPGGSGTNTFDEDGIRDNVHAVYLDVYSATNSTNNVHLTTDFGYQTGTTIEGTIWHDVDHGMETNREAGEDWLTNVTVYLCASPSPCGPGASLATNVATTNGYFRFVGSYTGTYTVMVATNTGMLSTGTWNLSWDTDGTNTANYSSVTVVSGGVARADFSYWRTGPYAIGDTLFYDWDGNGTQTATNEEGIANVTVYLYEDANGNGVVDVATDALAGITVTATNGYYSFTNLFATNTYLVVVDRNDPDLPPLYNVTADPWGAKDGRSVVTITNANDFAQDFGFQPYGTGSIGDTVWKDVNADGLQAGAQETGISNVLVSLYADLNGDGTYVLLKTANTGSTGTYLFGSLPDGDYRVVIDAADADLPRDAFGNVYYPTTATSFDVAISGGSTYLDADSGFAPYGAIGDTIFWDANRNGTQDYSEEGVAGVEVRLYYDANANGVYDVGETLATNAFTDAEGKYLFGELLSDRYVVLVVTTNGPLAGTTQSADPNSDGYACGDTNVVVPCDDQYGLLLGTGQNFMGADFGYAPPGVIGDRLWMDTNDDGLQDPGESGIPYVSVVLYSNGVAVATNETDADGYYYFSDLPDGTWSVVVLTNDVDFPPGLSQTYDPDGVLDNRGTNVVIAGGAVTSVGGVPCTGCDLSLDFGYRYVGNNSLSGTIGFDAPPYDGVLNGTNWNGVATNETAYAGVQVYLYLWNDDGDGIVEPGEYVAVASTTTSTNGDYAFTGLPSGDGDDRYVVASAAPENYLKLTTTNGSIAGVSVVETTNAQGSTVSAYLTVAVAPAIAGMDFAYRSTRNYDYGDLPETYETLLPGGARHIVVASNLYLGATVDVEPNGQPSAGADGDDLAGADDEDGVDLVGVWQDGPAGGTLEIAVGAGTGWLLGFIDFNGDGDFADFGELAINQAASSTGGTNGDGVYTILVDVPPGTINAATTTALNARFRLFPAAPTIPELAFSGTAANGEVEDYAWNILGSVGDYVWEDLNGDGVQDTNEPPVSGARVFIDLNSDGVYQTNEPSSTTGTNGFYHIGGLTPGTYSVRVDTNTLAVGLVPTWDRDGTGTKHVASVTLLQGEVVVDVDFGYKISVADLAVWKTVNTNAVNEGGTVFFAVSVTNLGPDEAETIAIGDLLPAGLTFVSSTPSQGAYDDGTGEWNVGTLAASNGATLEIEATADLGTGGSTFTNVASRIGSVPADPNPSNDVSSAAVTVRGADLQVRKAADNLRPDEGDPVTYRVSVTNLGPSETTGVVLSDLLPTGVTYASHVTSLGSYDDGTGLWTVGALGVGAGAWLDISVTVDIGTLGTVITNAAAVSAQDLPDPVATNDSAAVRIYVPPLVLYKTASTNLVQLGDTITYAIVATNIGPWAHTNVVIEDVLPAGTIYVPGSVALTAYPARSNALESARDEFSARTYTNQNGALAWSGSWQEGGESDGPTNGHAQVLATGWASLGLSRSLARAADLSLAESATLSFVLRQATVTRTNNVRDEFGAAAYTNSNGTLNWSGNWIETGDDLSATAGDILVSGGQLSFSGLEAADEIARWASFAGNTNATLSFSYVGSGLTATRSLNVYVRSNATDYLLASYTSAGSGTASFDLMPYLASSNRIIFRAGGTDWASQSFTLDNVNVALSRPMQTTLDNAYVEVSTNGADWTTLFYANGNVAGTVTTNYDLTAWRSPQTTVRFRTTGYTNDGAQLWFDDVDVQLSKAPGADELGDPPTLLSGWLLGTNEGVRITYDVLVDAETFTTQIVNVASATSDLQPDPVWAAATTRVDLVGVEIGDRVWFDADRDGVQDPGETNGIANLTVELVRTNGTVVQTTATDSDGLYLFDEVVPGRYYVRVVLTNVGANVAVSTNFAGGDVALDSDFAYVTNGVRRAESPAYDFADGTIDHTIDLGLRQLSSTRAELAEVWGESADGAARLVWRTSSEWNVAGFFVYRVDPETGAETRLNADLLPAAFLASGATYELADPAANAGGGTYRLAEVELSGAELDLGTHAVAFGPPTAAAKAARLAARAPKAAATKLAVPKLAGPSAVLKATFRQEGLYGVSLAAIAAGMGLAPEEAQALAAAGQLAFSEADAPVPTIYDAARERLLFHGRPTDDWYARDAAVLIQVGAGLAMPRREPAAAAGATVFPATVRFEEDRYPFDGATAKPDDFYYWDYVISGTNATATKRFALDLAGATGAVALKVRLQGWSSTTNDPDHLAEFFFNGAPVGSVVFDGQDAVEAELAIPAGAALAGTNELAVKGTLQPGRTHSYFVVDWIEATFSRELAPAAGTLHFRAGGAEAVSAAAFAEPVALALDEAGNPTWIADAAGALPDKAWAVVASSSERFAVAEADGLTLLEPEAVADHPWFLSATNRIDYLVLTSRELEEAAQELADYRAGQGLRVGVATFEDVCDWMAGGLRTPEAIPTLLAYAEATWAEAPWLVVLAGNGHYDYLNALNLEANPVPPLLVQTADGVFAGDSLLADADGDGLPDVALGRLPARTAAELAAMIAKIQAYEAGFGETWQTEWVLANDVNDAGAGDFAAANDRLAALADEAHPLADTIDLNATAIATARGKLLADFQGGAGIIHYTGHGGVANWSSKGLLKATDVTALTNASRPSAVLALSCLVGRYEAPGVNSLGELLMRKSGGAAVAVWGPSGLSRNDPATELAAAFYRAALQDGCGTLGTAILQARRSLAGDLFAADTLAIYNLLGDPALRIAGNRNDGAAAENFAQWRWERFAPAELAVPAVGGATDANFFDYAMDGGYAVEAELPEFGFALPEAGGEDGFILRWKRRMKRPDVEYHLYLSDDLWRWSDDLANLQELDAEPDPDGIMESVRTRVELPAAHRVFIGIRAVRK